MAGLDRLYGVIEVTSEDLFIFTPGEGVEPYVLGTMTLGPDDMPYVLDVASNTVYRVDLKRNRANAVVRTGREVGDTTVDELRFLSIGRPRPAGPGRQEPAVALATVG